jgi:putative inorganic carbon (HCO3(-)) transporter
LILNQTLHSNLRMQRLLRHQEFFFDMPGLNFANRDSIVACLAACVVGALLGGYVLLFQELPLEWAALSLIAVLFTFFVMIVARMRWLLLAVVLVDIPLQLQNNLFYREVDANFGAIGGLNVSVTLMALAALYALWWVESITQRTERQESKEPQKLTTFPTFWPLVAYIGIGALSAFVAIDKQLAFFEIALLVQMFLLHMYIVYTVRTRNEIIYIVAVMLAGLILESLIMIAVRAIGHTVEMGPIKMRIDDVRVGGTIGGPNTASGYLGLILALPVSVLFTNLRFPYKWVGAAAAVMGLVALILTQSRGGFVAFSLSLLIVGFFVWRKGWVSPIAPIIGMLLIAVLFILLQDVIVPSRFNSVNDDAATGRLPLLALAGQMIRENWILGIGINNFVPVMWDYITPRFSREWLYVVHNNYLLIWAQTGTGGILAFLWYLITTLRWGWRTWKLGDPLLSVCALGLTAGILGHMTHMMFDLFNSRPLVQALWVHSALIIALYNVHHCSEQVELSPS